MHRILNILTRTIFSECVRRFLCGLMHRLNCSRLLQCRRCADNVFHKRGPRHKTPIAKVVVWASPNDIAVLVERSRRLLTSETSRQLSDRYAGVWPVGCWKTRTATLNWTLITRTANGVVVWSTSCGHGVGRRLQVEQLRSGPIVRDASARGTRRLAARYNSPVGWIQTRALESWQRQFTVIALLDEVAAAAVVVAAVTESDNMCVQRPLTVDNDAEVSRWIDDSLSDVILSSCWLVATTWRESWLGSVALDWALTQSLMSAMHAERRGGCGESIIGWRTDVVHLAVIDVHVETETQRRRETARW